jgi:small ligand-binding sensory domain FIST
MKLFPYGHATHPQWRMAAGLVLAQLRAQMTLPDYAPEPRLALVYITDHYAQDAQALLDHLRQALPEVTDWAGTVGVGIAVNNAEYFDEPALAMWHPRTTVCFRASRPCRPIGPMPRWCMPILPRPIWPS